VPLTKRPKLKVFPLEWESFTDLTEVATQYECYIRDTEIFFESTVKELEEELQGCYENGLDDADYAVLLLKELLESLKE